MTKCGELIAEAHRIGAGAGGLPFEGVKLLLDALIKHFSTWTGQRHINIILAAGYNLKHNKMIN